MKKTFLIATLFFAIAVVSFLSCEKSNDSVSKQEFLHDAPNLANQTQGFYSKVGEVDIATAEDAKQQITIGLHDSSINPYEIRLYLANDNTQSPDLKSGKYEVLFLRSALILNDPVTGNKLEFVVKNDAFEDIKKKLPEGYFTSKAAEVVGIAVYGNHDNKRTNSDLVPTCATSGGPGSTSCSNTCCSVSCSTGYYASCYSSCTCIKSSGH